jgi:uncharacterized protein (TIGR02266 family)
MSASAEDKRKSARVPVDFEARFESAGRDYVGRVLNLSLDGLFLKTQQLFDTNDRLNLSFRLPGTLQTLNLNSRVIWGGSIEGSVARTFGLGVHFEEVPATVRQQLDNYIRSLLKT